MKVVDRCFEVRSRLKEGCIMYPWRLNAFFDRVVRRVSERVNESGVKLKDGS